jgi:hypothetical protein
MICRARLQVNDVGNDTLIRVPGLSLEGSHEPVTGRRAVLKMNACHQSVGINYAVECG